MPELGEVWRGCEIGQEKSPYHKYIWRACIKCGKERWVNMNTLRKNSGLCGSCSQKQILHLGHPVSEETKRKISLSHLRLNFRGDKNPLWKGGRGYEMRSGYVWVHVSSDDFFFPMARKGSSTGGRIAEHRLIMAKYLGRCLFPWEVIHHVNGIRDDNRIENLELIKGQKNHLPSIHSKQAFNRLNSQIELLKGKIIQLEATNHLLKSQMVATEN